VRPGIKPADDSDPDCQARKGEGYSSKERPGDEMLRRGLTANIRLVMARLATRRNTGA
jgi:hypothetical protein